MDPRRIPDMALVAARSMPHQLFDTVTDLAARCGTSVVISTSACQADTRALRRATDVMVSTVVTDPGLWRFTFATEDAPTALQADGPAMNLPQWSHGHLLDSGASWVLTPSFHVPTLPTGRPDLVALARLLKVTDYDLAGVLTHVVIDAAALSWGVLDDFLEVLALAGDRALAFTFTSTAVAFADRDAIIGLRTTLAAHPGSHVYGLDPVIALDALAHGAGLVAVGLTASYRHPRPPSPGDAGALVRERPLVLWGSILAMVDSSVLADMVADRDSPWCEDCQRYLDSFEDTDADASAVGRHNVHVLHEIGQWLLAHDPVERPDALAARLAQSLADYAALTGTLAGTAPVVDASLAALCELNAG